MPTSQRIALPQDMTIYNAMEQKQTLLEALAGTEDLELDLSGVAEIDTAGLQLLLLVKREAQRLNKRVAIVAHSQAVQSVIEFCNIAAELGDPMVIPAQQAT